MTRRVVAVLMLLAHLTASPITDAATPNVVIILADDLGYGDPQCYNPASKIETPNIDRLADRGVQFTDAHTPSSVCTPTRYALLTGRYCWRTRLTSGVLDGFSPPLIGPDRSTIASWLKQQGFATACIGKWHLGMQWTKLDGSPEGNDREDGFRSGQEIDFSRSIASGPTSVGFDSFFGISASLDMPPYCWIENDRCSPAPDAMAEEEYSLFLNQCRGVRHTAFAVDSVLPTLKQRTIAWINGHCAASTAKPFFLYLPLTSPHLPIAPSARFRGRSQVGAYGDFVMETDDFVGGVLETLARNNKLDNTLLIFTSDNGGLWHSWEPKEADDKSGYRPTARGKFAAGFGHRSNGGLRGTKADIYEGGHRVPLIAHWPNAQTAGKVSDAPVELTDIFATVADAVARPLPTSAAPDSRSFAHWLGVSQTSTPPRDVLVHHSLHGHFSVRRDGYKYVELRGSGGFSSPRSVSPRPNEPTGQLYDLSRDPKETRNIYLQYPERVSALANALDAIRGTDAPKSISPASVPAADAK